MSKKSLDLMFELEAVKRCRGSVKEDKDIYTEYENEFLAEKNRVKKPTFWEKVKNYFNFSYLLKYPKINISNIYK